MTVSDIVQPSEFYKEPTNPFVIQSPKLLQIDICRSLLKGKRILVSLACCMTSVTSSVYVSCILIIEAVETVHTARLSVRHMPAEVDADFVNCS